MPIEDKLWLPPLSPRDQKRLDRLRKNRKKPKQLLIIVVSIVAFVGVIALICALYAFNLLWIGRLFFLLITLGILLGIWLLLLIIFVVVRSHRTGFTGKTLWDWLQLLGILAIPLVVAGATLDCKFFLCSVKFRFLCIIFDLLPFCQI